MPISHQKKEAQLNNHPNQSAGEPHKENTMNHAIMTIKKADAVATEFLGKNNGYMLTTNLHEYITKVLSSPARVNSVKGAEGTGKTVGAVLLAKYLKSQGYESFVVIPNSNSNDRYWLAEPYRSSKEFPCPLAVTEREDVATALTADTFRIRASQNDKQKHFWIFEEWDELTEDQKFYAKKWINEYELRAIILGKCEFPYSAHFQKLFVAPIY